MPDEHPLPGRLEDQVRALADMLASEPKVDSVVLLGSLARGEGASAVVDGRLELFSDIELLAVTEGRLPSARRRELAQDVDAVARGFGYRNRLFHSEVAFRERSRLSSLPPIIFTHELAANGRTMVGAECLHEVRRVDLNNLDMKNTHEILMKRLWALAEALPPEWIRGADLLPIDARALGVALNRQPLDVPTVMLPEAGVLLSTYRDRARAWSELERTGDYRLLDVAVGGDSAAYVHQCLQDRDGAHPADNAVVAYGKAVAFIESALGVLTHADSSESICDAMIHRSAEIFNERPMVPGEWLHLARYMAMLTTKRGPVPAVRWMSANRKGLLAAGLLKLHAALADALAGDHEKAMQVLWDVRDIIAPIHEDGFVPIDSVSFDDSWLATRAALGRVFWRTIRLSDASAWERQQAALQRPSGGTG